MNLLKLKYKYHIRNQREKVVKNVITKIKNSGKNVNCQNLDPHICIMHQKWNTNFINQLKFKNKYHIRNQREKVVKECHNEN